ncbi:T9SS type A sorting domain-containing protein [Flavicella sediminum]|uniref:T9SS type A sorting domain-containing protein n=1 Tax=Flavicella sediminum TaxID=2585141 RepID=UPI001122D733|nr:T9SS type A sorting domain-containing protein [Flavicella sediminum]
MKKNYTLTFLFLLTILLGTAKVNAQTTLGIGDIAFTSINMDTPDTFSFVFLAPVLNGTTFYITDESWNGTTLATAESELLFTATDNIAAGEHVHIATNGGLVITFSSGTTKGTISSVGVNPANASMLAASGDNLFIHQGPQGNPAVGNFITGINANSGSSPTNAWQTTSDTGATILPSSLTEGQNAIGLYPPTGFNNELDNASYKAASLHVGTKADLLMALMDRSNWETHGTDIYNPIADSFTVTDALGINSQKANNGIQIFPNPASQEFSISLPSNSILKNAKLYSITGELIKTIHTTNCNISSIASGVYLVKVETNEGSFTEKIVKK